MSKKNTRCAILECAEKLLQERGYHGWSYQDIATEVGIRKASIHYYFPFKEDLGRALVIAYQARLLTLLAKIDVEAKGCVEKLHGFINFMGQVLEVPNMYCLCGMLAADFPTLDSKIQEQLLATFLLLQSWISRALEQGEREEKLRLRHGAELAAKMVLSSLEGMLLLSRLQGGKQLFLKMAREYIAQMLI